MPVQDAAYLNSPSESDPAKYTMCWTLAFPVAFFDTYLMCNKNIFHYPLSSDITKGQTQRKPS